MRHQRGIKSTCGFIGQPAHTPVPRRAESLHLLQHTGHLVQLPGRQHRYRVAEEALPAPANDQGVNQRVSQRVSGGIVVGKIYESLHTTPPCSEKKSRDDSFAARGLDQQGFTLVPQSSIF